MTMSRRSPGPRRYSSGKAILKAEEGDGPDSAGADKTPLPGVPIDWPGARAGQKATRREKQPRIESLFTFEAFVSIVFPPSNPANFTQYLVNSLPPNRGVSRKKNVLTETSLDSLRGNRANIFGGMVER